MNLPEELFESLQVGLSERGNTSLRNYENGDAIFFHEIAEGVWLEVVNISDNYPSWTVQTVNKTKLEIIAHIEENFSDPWVMQKNNIGANTLNDFSPINMEYVLEELETELYRKERMTKKEDIVLALNGILKHRDWTIRPAEHDKLVEDYFTSL